LTVYIPSTRSLLLFSVLFPIDGRQGRQTQGTVFQGVMKRPKVLLTGDCSFLLSTFEKLLESEFELVGTARNARALFSMASKHQPHVIVLDLSMYLAKDLKAARQIAERLPDTRLIFLGATTNWDQVQQAFRGGSFGLSPENLCGGGAISGPSPGTQGSSLPHAAGHQEPSRLPHS